MAKENWKRVQGTLHYYVSDQGKVYRDSYYSTYFSHHGKQVHQRWVDGGIVKTFLCGGRGENKYVYVAVENKNVPVHRLVAKAFCPGKDEVNNEINHINNNKSDNRACNLEWTSRKKNCQQQWIDNPDLGQKIGKGHMGKTKTHSEEWLRINTAYHKYLDELQAQHDALNEENRLLKTITPCNKIIKEMIKENAQEKAEINRKKLQWNQFKKMYDNSKG